MTPRDNFERILRELLEQANNYSIRLQMGDEWCKRVDDALSCTEEAQPVAWRYLTPTGWHATTDAGKALRAGDHHEMEPLYAAPQAPAVSEGAQGDEIASVLRLCVSELRGWMKSHGQDLRTQEAIKRANALLASHPIARAEGGEAVAFAAWFKTSGFWNDATTGKAWKAACEWMRSRPAPASKAVGLTLTDSIRAKLIELADELDGELDSGATWTKAQHTCCSVSGALRALAATQPSAEAMTDELANAIRVIHSRMRDECDAGPMGEGWQSDELSSAWCIVDEFVEGGGLDRLAENARELGLDYDAPTDGGSHDR